MVDGKTPVAAVDKKDKDANKAVDEPSELEKVESTDAIVILTLYSNFKQRVHIYVS